MGSKALVEPNFDAVRYLFGEGDEQPDPSLLRVNWRSNQQIAISKLVTNEGESGDDGMFVLNFFLDDRYFPFEGTGAVSRWKLDMPLENNRKLLIREENAQVLAIEDVVIHLRYTAKVDNDDFKRSVMDLMRGRSVRT